MNFEKVSIGGIDTACVTRKELAELICRIIDAWESEDLKDPFVIFSNNGHAISIYNSDSNAREQMNQADLVHADGQSVVFFSYLMRGRVIPERTATTDMIHDLPSYVTSPLSHFLLGGSDVTVKNAGRILTDTYGNFKLAGCHHGYFDESAEDEICSLINQANPDILWVGLGKPKEQIFCIRNRHKLRVPVIISCGGCYNYITGDYPRAPIWMQRTGFEWLYRLSIDPKKLFWRYAVTNPHAIFCVIKHWLLRPGTNRITK